MTEINVTLEWEDDSIRAGRLEKSYLIETDDGSELTAIAAQNALLADELAPEELLDGDLVRLPDPDLIRMADDTYAGRLIYARPNPLIPPTGTVEISFDIGWQTQRVMQSLATIATHAASGVTAPDFEGAINVTSDGVQGADVNAGGFALNRVTYLSNTAVGDPDAFAKDIAEFVGTVNSIDVGAFNAGELLLVGASLANRPQQEDWQLALRWSQRENITDLTVGSIDEIDHDGWDLRWTYYQEKEDAAANLIVRVPLVVYIERIFPRADHNLLPGM